MKLALSREWNLAIDSSVGGESINTVLGYSGFLALASWIVQLVVNHEIAYAVVSDLNRVEATKNK